MEVDVQIEFAALQDFSCFPGAHGQTGMKDCVEYPDHFPLDNSREL